MFPSAQNFSSNFSELYDQFKDTPSAWPDDILYKPFNPFWARPNDGKFYRGQNQSMFHPWDNLVKLFLGNRNMVYGGNVGPQASRNYAKRIQETYDQFYRYDYLHSKWVLHVGSILKDSTIQKDENRS